MEIDQITYKAYVDAKSLWEIDSRRIHTGGTRNGMKAKERRLGRVELLCDGWSGYGTTPLPVACTYKENGGGGNKMTALTLKLKRHF